MDVKIQFFISILAIMMMKKGIAYDVDVTADDVNSSSEMEAIMMKKEVALIGDTVTLNCARSKNRPYYPHTWLKNNKPLKYIEDMEIWDNGASGSLKIINLTLKSEGNYTCTCELGNCQPITYRLIVRANYTVEDLIEQNYRFTEFFLNLELKNRTNYKPVQLERQDFKTDVQKIFVKLGEHSKSLAFFCSEQNETKAWENSDKYTWLKDNKPLENADYVAYLMGDPAQYIRTANDEGIVWMAPVTKKHHGNYTCKCQGTSCVPYTHTYQVEVIDVEDV